MATFKSDAVKSGLMFLGTAQPGCVPVSYTHLGRVY